MEYVHRIDHYIDTSFPKDLPIPVDDGACNHLTGATLPSVSLPPTSDPKNLIDVSKLQGLSIIFCYPRTGAPDEKVPPEWDAIPGARGCTPQACGFRDQFAELRKYGVKNVFGVSTQDTAYQQEVHDRVHLPYDLLSDRELLFAKALQLPLFEYQGKQLIKRLAIAVDNGNILKHWYPVFPPDSNVHQVLEWLKTR